MSLLADVRSLVAPALAGLVPDAADRAEYLGMVKPAADPKNGDYQANLAMALAKKIGRPKEAKEVAAEVASRISAGGLIAAATVAGPGFINLRLSDAHLADRLRAVAADDRLGVAPASEPKTYIVEYSSPNVAKPLHVGHLRSTIIGDALARLLLFLGHTVVTDNHLGDWGTQFGMLIHGYRHHLDPAAYAADPVRELARLYVHVRSQFAKKSDDDEDDGGPADDPVRLACQQETAKLHAGDPDNLRLWHQFMPHCLESIHRIYRRLGTRPFDHEHGESFYNPLMLGVVAELLEKGLASESNGAVVVPNAAGVIPSTPEELTTQEPPGLVRKRDGAFTYTTSDLATIKYRMEEFRPDAMLYAVDFRQALHFKTVFAAARRWGYAGVELQHVSFGSVLGEDGKPFAARKGGAPELADLIDEAVRRGRAGYEESVAQRKATGHKVPDLSGAEVADIAEAVGTGAMKYADLSQNRTSNYTFSYSKMLATDGNTATYMQYAYTRCRGIFREDGTDPSALRAAPPAVSLGHPAERALGVQLLRFPDALHAAAADSLPHLVTAYLWDLAKAYSGFYVACPVLTADSPEAKAGRLLLVDLTARTLQTALGLLGIRTVERM